MKDFGPVESAPRGKGPRTKRQARKRQAALPRPERVRNWAPRTDGPVDAVRENGTLQADRSER